MPDLARIFIDAGFDDVTTYIQSGNVVFTHPARAQRKLQGELEAHIEEATGFDVPVVLRTTAEWENVVADNPYPGVEPTKLHVAFFAEAPPLDAFSSIDRTSFVPEEFVVTGREIYLHLPNGMGRAKVPLALTRPPRGGGPTPPPSTARNWRTVLQLLDLSRG